MTRSIALYATGLCTLVFIALLGLILLSTRPVSANPFEAYHSYMPGEDANDLVENGYCETEYPMSYYGNKAYLWCKLDDGMVRNVAVTMTDDKRVEQVYFFLAKCAVNAGDLVLWYNADVKAVRHGARLIIWSGGRAAFWYPRKSYWTPKACLWGVSFEAGL